MGKKAKKVKEETAMSKYAKVVAGSVKALAIEMPEEKDTFASELNAISGTEEKKSVAEILKAGLDKIAPKKKPDLKAVK